MKINNKYTKVIKETFNKCTDLRNNPHFQKILKDYKSLKDVTEYYNKKGDTLIKKNKTKKQDYEKSILFQIGIVVHREQEEKRKLEENKEKDKKEIKAKGKNINKEEEKQEEMENQEEQEDLKLSLDQSVLISNKLNKNGGKFKNPINKNRDTYFNNCKLWKYAIKHCINFYLFRRKSELTYLILKLSFLLANENNRELLKVSFKKFV